MTIYKINIIKITIKALCFICFAGFILFSGVIFNVKAASKDSEISSKYRSKNDDGKYKNTNKLLHAYLDLAAFRTKVISGNMANLNTPGYKAQEVEMPKTVSELMNGNGKKTLQLARTSVKHLPGSKQRMGKFASNDLKNPDEIKKNGNTVSLRQQMAKLSENNTDYNTVLKAFTAASALPMMIIGKK
jgi:flagellar basal-body rod protein FlgB